MAGSGKPKLVGLIGATGGVGRLCAAALQEQVSVRCMCARAIESSRVIVPPDASSRIIMMITKQGLSVRAIVRDTSRAKGLLPSSVQFVEAHIRKVSTTLTF